jgi:hypothetical protein
LSYDAWRAAPHAPYRVWAASQPPVRGEIDGRQALTIPACTYLVRHARQVPVYFPDSKEAHKVDVKDARWTPVGTKDERGYYGGSEQIPLDIVARMLDWAENYVRQHAGTRLIPRSYKSYQRNTYTAIKTAIISFTDLYEIENRAREQYDPAVRKYSKP